MKREVKKWWHYWQIGLVRATLLTPTPLRVFCSLHVVLGLPGDRSLYLALRQANYYNLSTCFIGDLYPGTHKVMKIYWCVDTSLPLSQCVRV